MITSAAAILVHAVKKDTTIDDNIKIWNITFQNIYIDREKKPDKQHYNSTKHPTTDSTIIR